MPATSSRRPGPAAQQPADPRRSAGAREEVSWGHTAQRMARHKPLAWHRDASAGQTGPPWVAGNRLAERRDIRPPFRAWDPLRHSSRPWESRTALRLPVLLAGASRRRVLSRKNRRKAPRSERRSRTARNWPELAVKCLARWTRLERRRGDRAIGSLAIARDLTRQRAAQVLAPTSRAELAVPCLAAPSQVDKDRARH
jgi:hypothetical protein